MVAAQLKFSEGGGEVGGAVSWRRFKNFFCLAWTGLNHVADWLPASNATVFRYSTNLVGLKLAARRVMNYYLWC